MQLECPIPYALSPGIAVEIPALAAKIASISGTVSSWKLSLEETAWNWLDRRSVLSGVSRW